MVSKELTRVIR